MQAAVARHSTNSWRKTIVIKVWDLLQAGLLDRSRSTFLYREACRRVRCLSPTPRVCPPGTCALGSRPVFEMNLPEGVLRRAASALHVAKATGTFDEFLPPWHRRTFAGWPHPLYRPEGTVTGKMCPSSQSMRSSRDDGDGDLFRYLLDKFTPFSGISGVQPKILVRDGGSLSKKTHRLSDTCVHTS